MNTPENTKVHGRSYRTRSAAIARIVELQKLNAELGDSDGRMTEMHAIQSALTDANTEAGRTISSRRRAGRAAAKAARSHYRDIYSTIPGYERSIHYIDADGHGRRVIYTTEMGFEVGYARLLAEGAEIVGAD